MFRKWLLMPALLGLSFFEMETPAQAQYPNIQSILIPPPPPIRVSPYTRNVPMIAQWPGYGTYYTNVFTVVYRGSIFEPYRTYGTFVGYRNAYAQALQLVRAGFEARIVY
jgi:hypothetical protein